MLKTFDEARSQTNILALKAAAEADRAERVGRAIVGGTGHRKRRGRI